MIKKLHDKDIREPLFDFLEEYYGKRSEEHTSELQSH